jgi:hypothetical protein
VVVEVGGCRLGGEEWEVEGGRSRNLGIGVLDSGFGLRNSGFGLKDSEFGLQVSGFPTVASLVLTVRLFLG